MSEERQKNIKYLIKFLSVLQEILKSLDPDKTTDIVKDFTDELPAIEDSELAQAVAVFSAGIAKLRTLA